MRRLLASTGKLCYHTHMKKNRKGTVCAAYSVVMCSLFLLFFTPKGYAEISFAKAMCFFVLTGLLLASLAVCRPSLPEKVTLPQLGIVLYLLLTAISALCSPWRETALLGSSRRDGAVTILLYGLMFFALSRYGRCSRFLLWAAEGAAAVYCIVCLMQLADLNPLGLYPEPLRWSGRETAYNGAFLGFTGNADLSAAVLAVYFGICWTAAVRKRAYHCLIPAALCLVVLLLSGMRGGTLGALGTLLLLPFVLKTTKKTRRYLLLTELLLLLIGLFLVWRLPLGGTAGELHDLLHGHAEDSYGSGRIYIWRNVWKLLPERLWLGGGADTLGLRLDAAFEKVKADGTVLRRSIDCAHNEYLNVLANQGLPALCCLLISLGVSLWKALKEGSDTSVILAAGISAYLIQAFFGISMPGSTAFLWLCWGLLEGEAVYGRKTIWILQL